MATYLPSLVDDQVKTIFDQNLIHNVENSTLLLYPTLSILMI